MWWGDDDRRRSQRTDRQDRRAGEPAGDQGRHHRRAAQTHLRGEEREDRHATSCCSTSWRTSQKSPTPPRSRTHRRLNPRKRKPGRRSPAGRSCATRSKVCRRSPPRSSRPKSSTTPTPTGASARRRSERLDVSPAAFTRHVTVRPTYVKKGDPDAVPTTAPLPPACWRAAC